VIARRCLVLSLALALALVLVLVLVLVGALASACSRAPEAEILLATAASMRVAMPDLIKAYTAKHAGVKVLPTYGSSGELRKQVEGGAPIDGVLFASDKPVDDLIKIGRIDASTRRVIATNYLVLIGAKGATRAKMLTFTTLAGLPEGERLAVGDPGAVPAGQYARELLQKRGVWDDLQGRLVLGSDVAAVLTYVRRGEVAAGIVYRTDTLGIDDIVTLDEAKGEGAPRAEVVVGVVKGARAEAGARSFLELAASPEGQKILADHGFGPP
jgi:molybdate transport system substrate-binding protein